jgi:hypothetical protein
VTRLQHLCQAMDRGHTTVGYMFGFLTVDNTGTSPKAAEQVLEVLDTFSAPSIADPTIRNWIRSVRKDAVLMVRRYEMELYSLCWGVNFGRPRCRISRTS